MCFWPGSLWVLNKRAKMTLKVPNNLTAAKSILSKIYLFELSHLAWACIDHRYDLAKGGSNNDEDF